MQGFLVLYITPKASFLDLPEGWIPDFDSDPLPEPLVVFDDRFVDFDHEPTLSEQTAQLGANEKIEELRKWPNYWRLRIRYPITLLTVKRGGILRLYRLVDNRINTTWGHEAVFWGVFTTAAKHIQLHNHIANTLGFGPIGGAWAAVDPQDQNRFLDRAVQTALGLTNQQQLTRITALRNALQNIGFTPTELSALLAAPAGKTEHDLVRALVHDLGFTMLDLKNAAMDISS